MHITTINTIESSSLCDLKCPYCPASIQHKHRETGFMSWEVFEKAIEWVKYYCIKGTQRELNLFGVGEPMLHPDVVSMVEHARQRLPFRQDIHLNTNGNNMTEQLARDLQRAGVTAIDITGHNARAAAKTIRIFRKLGIKGNLSVDYITRPNNWAGQVDWFKPEYYKAANMLCPWLDRGQVMVMSDGNITRCCIDAFANGVFTNVSEDITEKDIEPFGLCDDCHHVVPERFERLIKVA